ncbi:VOC family protein [Pseudorhodobacter sp. E13]|uniref:VOC family protein n=1 Tax=Pseudorhodobacter sp. E13 TaxID=2487931 RepID=UPI000F8F3489|nr:VOC family protein [Pseudorhodobacter sp. E13]RUS59453.1 VOC family protein [Pseudorhodobacter sp. E13]
MITGIDHLVLTVRDPDASVAFFGRALGLEPIRFGAGRLALRVGDQKINLQTLGQETRNHACIGSGDICLLTDVPLADVVARLTAEGIAIVEGPVQKSGARGPVTSVYFNDPDGNLIEISRYGTPDP